jgi:Domain of unknown function (DUF3333).
MNKEERLIKRYKAEKRFQFYGKAAIFMALLFLVVFLTKIFSTGYTAFQKTWLVIPVNYNADLLYLDPDKKPTTEDINDADFYEFGIETFITLDPDASEDQIMELKKNVCIYF